MHNNRLPRLTLGLVAGDIGQLARKSTGSSSRTHRFCKPSDGERGSSVSFDPLVNFCGEQPGYPIIASSPAGGVNVQRELLVFTQDVMNWTVYFLENPIDPYTFSGNLWKWRAIPFEKAERTAANINIYGPGVVLNEFSLLSLEYESAGIRFYPGLGRRQGRAKPRWNKSQWESAVMSAGTAARRHA